jgi:hypothetical protein
MLQFCSGRGSPGRGLVGQSMLGKGTFTQPFLRLLETSFYLDGRPPSGGGSAVQLVSGARGITFTA